MSTRTPSSFHLHATARLKIDKNSKHVPDGRPPQPPTSLGFTLHSVDFDRTKTVNAGSDLTCEEFQDLEQQLAATNWVGRKWDWIVEPSAGTDDEHPEILLGTQPNADGRGWVLQSTCDGKGNRTSAIAKYRKSTTAATAALDGTPVAPGPDRFVFFDSKGEEQTFSLDVCPKGDHYIEAVPVSQPDSRETDWPKVSIHRKTGTSGTAVKASFVHFVPSLARSIEKDSEGSTSSCTPESASGVLVDTYRLPGLPGEAS